MIKEVEEAAVIAARRDPNRQLFDQEFSARISALKRYSCPRVIIKTLESKRLSVIIRAGKMTFLENKLSAFYPVIPASLLSIAEQMWMIKNGDIQGCAYLDTTHIDLAETPREPYWIFSIEDGSKTLGWTPLFGEKVFKAQPNRRGLSIAEAISLCRHAGTLKRHNVDAIWSRLRKEKIPFIWLLDKEPRIGADRTCASSPRWGIPSCSTTVI